MTLGSAVTVCSWGAVLTWPIDVTSETRAESSVELVRQGERDCGVYTSSTERRGYAQRR